MNSVLNNYYLFLVIYWLIYLALHSVLASIMVKTIAKRILGNYFRFYRIFYVVISSIALIFIWIYMSSGTPLWIIKGNILTICLAVLIIVSGIIIIIKSFNSYNLREFIGISYLKGTEQGYEKLKTKGILSMVRHPIYSGTILIFTGYFLGQPSLSNLLTLICILSYIFIGIRLEEKKLLIEFGEPYSEYRKRVPMLLPGIRLILVNKKHQKN